MPTLREQQEAKLKATEEFKTKWGTVGKEGTATTTDIVKALLTSNNQHYGTDTRNLIQYLDERDYDISAIVSGKQQIPEEIFKPQKKTELRESIQQEIRDLETHKLTDEQIIANAEKALKEPVDPQSWNTRKKPPPLSNFGRNNRPSKATWEKWMENWRRLMKEEPIHKKNIADAQERIKQREAEIFNTSTTLSELDKEIIKHEEEVIRDVTTSLQTHQKMKKMSIILPVIVLAVVGLIAVYLIRRKK